MSINFESNRVDGKIFKAKIVREDMLLNKKDDEVTVSYYDYHYGYHMWKSRDNSFLVYYEHEIALIAEVQEKVA